jgi:RNA polymerase sigma-70 factor, ECF subfamily
VAAVSDELAVFCAREWPRVVGALRLAYGDAELAEEIAQEALEKACLRWRRVRTMEHPSAWVHRVAFNAATSRFRRVDAGRRALLRHGPGTPEVAPPDADHLALRDAIASLELRPRTALVLRYYVEMTPAEAGEVMGCSAQAVRNLTHRALQALRIELGPDGDLGRDEQEATHDVR